MKRRQNELVPKVIPRNRRFSICRDLVCIEKSVSTVIVVLIMIVTIHIYVYIYRCICILVCLYIYKSELLVTSVAPHSAPRCSSRNLVAPRRLQQASRAPQQLS